ncbi:putative quinol monooxygenase [Glaciimonas sp. Gout2]|uniref:putative quinol monooxygenase n=1 Tax=unclassified Glaciimonas TaxID=2644401 RepID=UPI002AB4ED0C|nr:MULTISPECIES: putative quinol monooxygenase [unclassified Glaciimonas]MDY7548215.1 putative quinol monooxygenase [Glaciimonas sp. CA11.2]MEB0010636.1 putative quinol monooxygenase [Glaciimonas sp. Cout2]MEB0084697.1 putative quinol monooxygenase [Glaciimonas sp. Gout2]
MSQIAVVSINTAKPGQEKKMEAAMRALIAPSQRDPGFIQYDLHRDLDDPRTFVFFERWESRELLHQHFKAPHVIAWIAQAGELVESSTLRIMENLG